MACDPNTLIEQAKCINACIPQGMMPAVNTSLLCQILAGSGGGGEPGTETFTVAGADTWTAPEGITQVIAECWGGGGASGWGILDNFTGGGGGAYAKKTIVVVPGTLYNLFVGAGGVPNVSNATGTWFVTSGTVFADFGEGGDGGAPDRGPGLASASIGDVKFNGGTGGDSSPTGSGGGGSSAGIGSIGTNGVDGGIGTDGAGGIAPAGGGNGGNGETGAPAFPGVVPGGGGGGCDSLPNAAVGASGKLILTW